MYIEPTQAYKSIFLLVTRRMSFWVIFLMFFNLIYGIGSEDTNWTGKWFPGNPNESYISSPHSSFMGIVVNKCDNAEDKLSTDFDPQDISESLGYICVEKPFLYKHNYSVQPTLKEYVVSPYYVPLHKCMNESIDYEERLPAFGAHRPLWAKYGEYKYLPIQRWLHNLEHGAIVMLYHPCAYYDQVEMLKLLVVNCLYRHIISPSKRLLPQRPMALIAWGKSLEMSVVDTSIVINFIKGNALRGPEKTSRNGQYDKLLVHNSKVISNEDDTVLCPNYV